MSVMCVLCRDKMITTTMVMITSSRADGGKGRDADDCACCGWMVGEKSWMMGIVTVAMLRARRGTAEERCQERGERRFHWRETVAEMEDWGWGAEG